MCCFFFFLNYTHFKVVRVIVFALISVNFYFYLVINFKDSEWACLPWLYSFPKLELIHSMQGGQQADNHPSSTAYYTSTQE